MTENKVANGCNRKWVIKS